MRSAAAAPGLPFDARSGKVRLLLLGAQRAEPPREQQPLAFDEGAGDLSDTVAGGASIPCSIDRQGGIVRSIEEGFPQREIANSAYQFQREVDAGARSIVGVNKYVVEEPDRIPTLKIEHAVERSQIERVKSTRDQHWEKRIAKGLDVNRTMAIAHLGGATLDNEENYLIKKLFTALGMVQIENQARI